MKGSFHIGIVRLSLLVIAVWGWPLAAQERTDKPAVSYPPLWSILKHQWGLDEKDLQTLAAPYQASAGSPATPLPLSLKESIHLALRGNVDIAAQQYTPKIAQTGVMGAKGPYDFHLTANAGHTFTRSPLYSQLQGTGIDFAEMHTTAFDIGINKMIQSGGVVEVKFDVTRYKTNSTFFILNPNYASHLNFSIAQPLLKNAGFGFHQARIRVAKNLHLMSEDRFREFVGNTLSAVEHAYWDLVFAFQNRQVRKESLELARDLLRKNELQVQVGTMAAIDILQAKTGVALREEELIASENLLQTSQDHFKDVLQVSKGPDSPAVLIIPTETPPDPPESEQTKLEEDIKTALKHRAEYQALRKELVNKNLQVKIAENQLLPSLDVTASIGLNGLGGSSQEVPDWLAFFNLDPASMLLALLNPNLFPTAKSAFDGGLKRSLEELGSGDYYQWTLGMRFDIPLENRTAKANFLKSKFEAYQSLVTLKSLADKIAMEVMDASRNVETSRQRIRTSEITRQLAREQLAAEQKKLAVGLSSNYQVLKMEEDLRNAEVNALKSRVDYWKAKVLLERAKGTLLEKEGVNMEEDLAPGPEEG
jgi:outer membrane protein